MIRENEVVKIGQLAKTHGIKGELNFRFDNDVFDQVDCPYLILKIDNIFVPFFLVEYRFRSDDVALVTFEDINDEIEAAPLQGLEVYFPRKYYIEKTEEETEFTWDFFIGFTIKTANNREEVIGKIISVDTQTLNTLFLVEAADGEEIIIPAAEEFIKEIDTENITLYMELPEGLI